MVEAFNILLHVLLAGSLLLFLYVIVRLALAANNPMEKAIRILAILAGVLLVLGAGAAGVDYATFTVQSLAGARPASAAASVGTAVVPALIGAAVGFYIIRVYRRSTLKAIRVLCFIGMLTVVAFVQVYAEAAQVQGVILGAAAIPNVTFILGIVLVIVFTSEAEDEAGQQKQEGGLSALMGLIQGRFRPSEGGLGGPSEQGKKAFTPGRPVKVDPFS